MCDTFCFKFYMGQNSILDLWRCKYCGNNLKSVHGDSTNNTDNNNNQFILRYVYMVTKIKENITFTANSMNIQSENWYEERAMLVTKGSSTSKDDKMTNN